MSIYTSASNNTRWKNDYMEKRRRGRSEVPEWKRDLLKRIHSKKALERKQRMDTKPDEDVVEEHIPKVNENVFLVHEKQHHPRATIHNEQIDSTVTNHDVIPQNVIIIENDGNVTNKPTNNQPNLTTRDDVEMPSSGIVHRLMGRFEGGAKTQIRHRSKSTTSLWSRKEKTRLGLNDNNNDISKMTNKSHSLSRAFSTDTPSDIYTTEALMKDKVIEPPQAERKITETKKLKESKAKFTEVEKHYHISNVVPMPYHKTREAHPVKTPILSPKSPVQRNAPSRFAIPKKEPAVVDVKTTIDTSSLHATNENGGAGDEVVNKAVKLAVSDVPPPSITVKETSVKVAETRHQDKLPNGEALHSNGNEKTVEEVTPPPRVNRFRREKRISEDKKSTGQTNRSESVTNDAAFTCGVSANVKVVRPAPKSEINPTIKQNGIETPTPTSTSEKLSSATPGNIKFDNVVVNDENANAKTIKALLDYASKSKTIQITPKKSSPMQETVKPVLPDSTSSDVLPATSIDDVIVPVEVAKVEEKPPSIIEEIKKDTLKTTVSEPKPVARTVTPTPRTTRPTTVTPSGGNTKSSSIFGTRVQRSKPSPQGGRSFVIDPSKFKNKNSPNEQTTTKVTTVTTTTTKRKPTVDEIVVIGGYVKLERSCLTTTTNKKKKITGIKFDLEEVTHEYISERSLIAEHTHEILQNAAMKKTPGQDKDVTFGKYTPKYLLSMGKELLDHEKITSPQDESVPTDTVAIETNVSTDAKPTDDATKWSEDTSADMLF